MKTLRYRTSNTIMLPMKDFGCIMGIEKFFNENPEFKSKVVVHHAVDQQVLKKYSGSFYSK